MTALYNDTITIYNDIPANEVTERHFDRHVISKCFFYTNLAENADNTIQKIINTQNVITRDVSNYLSPKEYASVPQDLKDNYYTVQIDDFVVLGEVDDIVSTARDFQALKSKYNSNGFSVTAVMPNIHGMENDNVQITG